MFKIRFWFTSTNIKILTNNKLKLEIFIIGHIFQNFGLTINEFLNILKNLIFSKTLKFLPKNKDVDIASYSKKLKRFSNY